MKHVTMNLLNYFWKKGIKPIIANVEKKIDSTGDASNATVSFEQAQNRTNISSGDSLKTLFGKIMKTFADLKSVAFSGSYTDLSNKPTIPTVPAALKNPQALTFTGGVTGSYDGSAAKSVKIPSGTNSLLANVAGTWLDAIQGAVLKRLHDDNASKITQINSDLTKKQIDFTLANGVTRQAGLSWLRGNIVCLSTCLKISKNITANTNIITGMTAAGSPVKVEFTYGVCNQKGAKIIPLIAMQGIAYCEDDLLVADGEYIIISAACSLLN